MPSTYTNSHHPNSSLARIRGRPPLATITAAAGAALVAGATLSLLSGGAANAAAKPAWMMTGSNIQSLSQTDSATASHFSNTPTAFGAGASLVKTPVQAG